MSKKIFSCFFLTVLAAVLAFAQDLKLPSIFSRDMMLQAGKDTAVFGFAAPGAEVQVVFDGNTKASARAQADESGRWLARLPELVLGDSGELKISSGGQTKVIENVLIGELWLCAGQSNMDRTVNDANVPQKMRERAAQEAQAVDGKIRQFRSLKVSRQQPQDDVGGQWMVIDAQNVGKCSAVAWNFGQRIFEETKQPVGLVNVAWGGTPIESWLPREFLDKSALGATVWQRHEEEMKKLPERKEQYKQAMEAFNQKYTSDQERKKHRAKVPRTPYDEKHSHAPTGIFNAMVYPIINYTFRGMIWYQGESNAARPQEYGTLACAMVEGYRSLSGQKLPFYYVELANFKEPQTQPSEGGWALLREGQQAVLKLPDTGVATAIDVGMADDIHPIDKKTTGHRLAGLALQDIYGKPIQSRSPQYADSKITGDTVFIKFDNAGGLRSRTDKIGGFAVSDGEQWLWADDVKILDGGVLAVRSTQIKKPVAVRYAWADNPVISLENKEGLPLRPFRTDTNSER